MLFCFSFCFVDQNISNTLDTKIEAVLTQSASDNDNNNNNNNGDDGDEQTMMNDDYDDNLDAFEMENAFNGDMHMNDEFENEEEEEDDDDNDFADMNYLSPPGEPEEISQRAALKNYQELEEALKRKQDEVDKLYIEINNLKLSQETTEKECQFLRADNQRLTALMIGMEESHQRDIKRLNNEKQQFKQQFEQLHQQTRMIPKQEQFQHAPPAHAAPASLPSTTSFTGTNMVSSVNGNSNFNCLNVTPVTTISTTSATTIPPHTQAVSGQSMASSNMMNNGYNFGSMSLTPQQLNNTGVNGYCARRGFDYSKNKRQASPPYEANLNFGASGRVHDSSRSVMTLTAPTITTMTDLAPTIISTTPAPLNSGFGTINHNSSNNNNNNINGNNTCHRNGNSNINATNDNLSVSMCLMAQELNCDNNQRRHMHDETNTSQMINNVNVNKDTPLDSRLLSQPSEAMQNIESELYDVGDGLSNLSNIDSGFGCQDLDLLSINNYNINARTTSIASIGPMNFLPLGQQTSICSANGTNINGNSNIMSSCMSTVPPQLSPCENLTFFP